MRHKRTIWISLIYFGRKENASTLNPPCHKTPLLLQRSKAIAALPLQWHQREQANQHLSDPGGLWRQDDRTSFHERSFFGSTCFAKGPTQLTAPQARHSKLKQYQNSQIRKLKLKLTSVYQSTAVSVNFCSLLPSQSAKSEDQTREGSHASGRQLLRSVELHHAWTNIHRIYPSTIRHRDTQTLGYVRISNLGTPLNSKSFHKQFSSEKVPPHVSRQLPQITKNGTGARTPWTLPKGRIWRMFFNERGLYKGRRKLD